VSGWARRPLWIVLEWGDSAGAPFVISGQAWGEENIFAPPAILDMPTGRGHVVSFNFNPFTGI